MLSYNNQYCWLNQVTLGKICAMCTDFARTSVTEIYIHPIVQCLMCKDYALCTSVTKIYIHRNVQCTICIVNNLCTDQCHQNLYSSRIFGAATFPLTALPPAADQVTILMQFCNKFWTKPFLSFLFSFVCMCTHERQPYLRQKSQIRWWGSKNLSFQRLESPPSPSKMARPRF